MSKYITAIAFFACLAITTDAFAKPDYTLRNVGEEKNYKLEVDIEDGAAEPVVTEMNTTFRDNTDAMRRCVGKATTAKATFDVHIASDGTVEKIDVTKDSTEKGIAACVGGLVDDVEFPKADEKRVIGVALEVHELKPENAKPAVGRGDWNRRSGTSEGFGRVGGLGKVDKTKPKPPKGKPVMEMEVASIDGPREQASATNSIERKGNAFRYCYEKNLRVDPELAGKVTLKVQVAENGRTANPEIVANDLGSFRARSCLKKVMLRTRFDAADAPSTITIHFEFRLEDAE
ncbi:MAG: AgmX/PglI C-terminal domain-containing protein [Myxococcota bacterium]